MNWVGLKVVIFMALFAILQGIIMPWVISNAMIPLWADIGLLAIIACMWWVIADVVMRRIIKYVRKHDLL